MVEIYLGDDNEDQMIDWKRAMQEQGKRIEELEIKIRVMEVATTKMSYADNLVMARMREELDRF